MNSTTSFIWEKLYPSLFDRIDQVFPEMNFTKKGDKWISPFKRDGSKPSTPRRDKTYISEKYNGYVAEQGEDNPLDIITLYAEKNGYDPKNDLGEILKDLCSIAGIDAPQRSEEWERKYQAEKDRQDKLLASYERQKKALFAPEGKEVLQYLTNVRRYTEEEVRLMGLGFISQSEAERLQNETGIGVHTFKIKNYPLSWGYYSKGRIHGFKFRCIIPEDERLKREIPKYDNTNNLPKNTNPFGLTSRDQSRKKSRILVVVEGELDALHCIVKGLKFPIVATTGNGLTSEAVNEIKGKGFRDIILLLDNDPSGHKFVPTSIKNIEEAGLNAFVSVIPEGAGHDPDEFFKFGNSVEELTDLLLHAYTAKRYQYNVLIQQYGTNPSELEYSELEERFVELASKTTDPVQRHKLLFDFANKFGLGSVSTYEKAITEKVNEANKERDAKNKKKKVEEALKKALNDLQSGETTKAEKTLSELRDDMRVLADPDQYKEYLFSNSDEIFQSLKRLPEGLNSGFQIELESDNKKKQELIFPESGITLIGASSNHGKSTVLKNIVINALNERKRDLNGNETTSPVPGTLLYFTYEENMEAVTRQFINAYANVNLNPQSFERKKNIEIIEEVFAGYDTNLVHNSQTRKNFFIKVREFKKILDEQRLKIIRLNSNFHDDLLGVLRYLKEQFAEPVRAVFVDYVQCLSVDNNGKTVIRTEELKEIMTSIDKYVQEANIPFIMTAQLSRSAKSFNDLRNSLLSDSSWLEKTASEIILLWSNRFKSEVDKDQVIDARLRDGLGGVIGAKLTKSRRYGIPSVMFLDIDERTGKMSQSHKVDIKKEPTHRFNIDAILADEMFEDSFFSMEKPEQTEIPYIPVMTNEEVFLNSLDPDGLTSTNDDDFPFSLE